MSSGRFFVRNSILLTVASLLAACAQNGSATLPNAAMAPQLDVFPAAAPPACTGQKTSKDDASLAVTLSSKGGSFCVPAFGGFGGTVSYPKANPSIKATVTSSTTDYKKLPQLGQGTAIFYLQLALAGGTTFGSKIRPVGGITSATIKSGQAYTAYGQATIGGGKYKFGPCYVTATKGKYGGVLTTVGALLEYGDAPVKANAFIEIYSGKQTKSVC